MPPANGGRWRARVGALADATILIPLVVALGLLAFVSYLASARHSGTQLVTIAQHTWFLILLLTFPYLLARALVWYELLQEVGISVSPREMAAAFAGGEITKSLPAGIYVQNFLLGRLAHLGQHSLVRSTGATTAMLGLESFLAVPVVLVIGIPGQPWVRWALLAVIGAWLVFLLLVAALVRYRFQRIGPNAAAWRRRLLAAAEEFFATSARFINVKTLLALIPTALYMLIYAIDLYAILRAVGVSSVSFADTIGIYAAVVLAVVLIPIPTEMGITEVTGLGALVAYGIPRAEAAVVMLSLRLLATGMTILIAGLILLILHNEWRHDLRDRPAQDLPNRIDQP